MRDNRLHVDSLPAEVQKLCEVMAGIDPNWSLEDWLRNQASSSLELISSELEVELKTAEQRLKRITDIKMRITNVSESNDSPNQMNLFDCFSIEYDKSIIGLGSRAVSSEEEYTDDVNLAFLDEKKIEIICGSEYNLKITTPEDIKIAEKLFLNV